MCFERWEKKFDECIGTCCMAYDETYTYQRPRFKYAIRKRKRFSLDATIYCRRSFSFCWFSGAYGSSVVGNVARYSSAFWIAGGIGGGVGKWAPCGKMYESVKQIKISKVQLCVGGWDKNGSPVVGSRFRRQCRSPKSLGHRGLCTSTILERPATIWCESNRRLAMDKSGHFTANDMSLFEQQAPTINDSAGWPTTHRMRLTSTKHSHLALGNRTACVRVHEPRRRWSILEAQFSEASAPAARHHYSIPLSSPSPPPQTSLNL